MDAMIGTGSLLLAVVIACATAFAQPGPTLTKIRARGYLLCGIDRSEAEYSSTDEHGSRTAFDRELCRAIAITALGPKARMVVTLYADDMTSLQALADGHADVIATLSVHLDNIPAGLSPSAFGSGPPMLFDPVSLMVVRSSGVAKASQLSGKLICMLSETHTQEAVQLWFTSHHLNLLPFPFQEEGEMEAAFVTNHCVGLAGDRTRLLETLHDTGSMANRYNILPDSLSPDTLRTTYRIDDPAWKLLVDSSEQALLTAKDHPAASTQPNSTDDLARTLDIPNDWTRSLISTVGTYDEIFLRSFGRADGTDQLRVDRTQQ